MKSTSTYKSVDLKQLSQQLAEGNVHAMEVIYRTYFHRLRKYGVHLVGLPYLTLVEDVVQEFFIWLAQNHLKVAKVNDFEAYMFQAIRRNVYARIGTDKQADLRFERFVDRTGPIMESTSPSPEHAYIADEEKKDRSTRIQAELAKLPPYLREILYLRYFEDKSYKEIGSILSISDQVAYNYVSRAIKRLKKQIANLSFLLFCLFQF